MFNLFQQLVSIITSIVTVLTFQNYAPTPTVSPEPSNTPTESTSVPIPTPSNTSRPTPSPTPDITGLIKQLNELKQQITAYTPEPKPTPQVIIIQLTPTPTPVLSQTPSTPSPSISPIPMLGIMLVDLPTSIHKCKDYEKRVGLTQHFEMEYRGEINAEDYTWYSPWAKPTYWHGSRGQMTFNMFGEHFVALTDKWGQKTQCWINLVQPE